MRAIRLFIAEGEGAKGKASGAQGTGTSEKAPQESVTYQVPEPPSALVREEEFCQAIAASALSCRVESAAVTAAGARS